MKFKYQFFGGKYDMQEMDEEQARELAHSFTPDRSEIRAAGMLTQRQELDNQPQIDGYCGPMWDGMRYLINGELMYDFRISEEQKAAADEVYGILRYETQEVYDLMSN